MGMVGGRGGWRGVDLHSRVNLKLEVTLREVQSLSILSFALLYLRSDSTTVPIADAKLSCPRDAFKTRSN